MFRFLEPNIKFAFWECLRYEPGLTYTEFETVMKQGYTLKLYPEEFDVILNSSGSEPSYWDRIIPEKRFRVLKSIRSRNIEMPVLLESNKHFLLVTGNTRLTALARMKVCAYNWVIRLDKDI